MNNSGAASSGTAAPQSPDPRQQQLRYIRDYVAGRLMSYGATVRTYVDDRIRKVSETLNGRVMTSADKVADKLNDIARDAGGECAYDDSDSTRNVYVTKKRLRVMNEMRKSNRMVYDELTKYAAAYRQGTIQNDNKELVKFFADVTRYAPLNPALPPEQRNMA